MLSRVFLALALSTAAGFASAAEMSAKDMAEASAKVQAAVVLANVAKETKDGDMMLSAARLMGSVGPVSMMGKEKGTYDVKKMAAEAKAMGADPKKADMLATMPVSNVKPTGQWVHGCDSSGYCAWWWED